MTEGLVIGIDLGGTKIAGGLVDPATGRIALRLQEPTRAEEGGAAVLARVAAMMRRLVALAGPAPVACAGLGVPELVSRDGRVFSGHRIDWRGLAVAERLAEVLPTHLDADVRAAALAEMRFGAGRGLGDLLYVTIGTGVSCVAVLDGRPYGGARGAALVMANGTSRQCCDRCGAVTEFTLEDVASGPGLVAAFRAAGGRAGGAEDVLAAAAAGDGRASAVIGRAALRLGQALALLAGALDPAAIVLGGGLGAAPGPYSGAIARAVAAGLWSGDPRPLPVWRAGLGPDAGLIGAALAAHDRFTGMTTGTTFTGTTTGTTTGTIEPDNRPDAIPPTWERLT